MQYSCRTYILLALHRSGFFRRAKPQWLQKIRLKKKIPPKKSNSQGAIEWIVKWNRPSLTGAALQCVTLWGRQFMSIATEEATVKYEGNRQAAICCSPLATPQLVMSQRRFSFRRQRQNTCQASDITNWGMARGATHLKVFKPQTAVKHQSSAFCDSLRV